MQQGLDPQLISAALQRRANGNIRMDAGAAPAAPGGQPPMEATAPAPAGGTPPEQVNPEIAGVQKAALGTNVPDEVKVIARVLIKKLTDLL